MDFWLKFKPRIDSRERGFIFINDLPYIFEYICSIAMINSFDVLEDFDTDRNEVILINTEWTSITDDFHEDQFGVIEVNNILYELHCLIYFSNIDSDSTNKWHGKIYSRHGGNYKSWWVAHRNSRFGLQTHSFITHDDIHSDNQWFV